MRLLAGPQHKQAIARWVAERVPFVGSKSFDEINCIGVVGRDGTPICGVVFHDWQPEFSTMAFSIAADSPRWATHSIIGQLLAYPFDQAKITKLWTATPSTNERALRLVKGVGFTQEATLARHFGKYGHAIISRMFLRDYIRLYGERSGKTKTANAA